MSPSGSWAAFGFGNEQGPVTNESCSFLPYCFVRFREVAQLYSAASKLASSTAVRDPNLLTKAEFLKAGRFDQKEEIVCRLALYWPLGASSSEALC